MSYEQRINDAKYDEMMGNHYNKCEYCYRIIDGKTHTLKDGFRIFCSNKCKRLWNLDKSDQKFNQTNPERFQL